MHHYHEKGTAFKKLLPHWLHSQTSNRAKSSAVRRANFYLRRIAPENR